jgi:hypothetical protein
MALLMGIVLKLAENIRAGPGNLEAKLGGLSGPSLVWTLYNGMPKGCQENVNLFGRLLICFDEQGRALWKQIRVPD